MAKGEQHPFGHDLSGQFGLATEGVYNPRHLGPALFVEAQQSVEGPHAVDDHRLPDGLGHCNLGTEGRLLHIQVAALQGVEAALADGPHVGQRGVGLHPFHLLPPVGIDLPRMQAYRTGLHPSRHLARPAVEHELLGRVCRYSMGVKVEHNDVLTGGYQ